MTNPVSIAIARGNGIGPEIMDATLSILTAAGANIKTEEIEIGEDVYAKGVTTGIEPSAWDVLRKTKVFLKAPITTPQGGGFKSLNVNSEESGAFCQCQAMPLICACAGNTSAENGHGNRS